MTETDAPVPYDMYEVYQRQFGRLYRDWDNLSLPWTSTSGFVFFVLRAEADVVRSNIAVLVSTGLGPRAEDDFLLARVTCMALLKLAKTHKVN